MRYLSQAGAHVIVAADPSQGNALYHPCSEVIVEKPDTLRGDY